MGNAATGTGQSVSAIAADTWVNESGGPLTVTYVVKPVSADNCEGEDYTIVVTVNFLPVHNTIQNTYYQTIQAGIAAANANDVLELGNWTFNEAVTIDKSLTLKGSTADKTMHVIDGTSLGTNSGITINSGVINVTIEDLTVQDFAGSSGNTHAGIYAIGGNNGLTIDNVALLNNSNASGFYANGPVDDVSITNSMVSGNGGGARGIVVGTASRAISSSQETWCRTMFAVVLNFKMAMPLRLMFLTTRWILAQAITPLAWLA